MTIGFLTSVFLVAAAAVLVAQSGTIAIQQPPKVTLPTEAPDPEVEFVCPMDPDIRSKEPGKCPRCGMKLVAGIPEMLQYPVVLTTTPKVLKVNSPIELQFTIENPKTLKPVTEFEIMHERLFHLFLVSQDLDFFAHLHPIKNTDSLFLLKTSLPKPGMYRVLSDFYPKGGTPQLIAKTLFVGGPPLSAHRTKLRPDLSEQKGSNMDVSLTMEPAQPIAGMKTLLFFHLSNAEGFEPYIGAWGHMLAASEDVVDMIHSHPFLADGGPQVQFNMIFPRAVTYKVWVQFQRKGVVNTVAFNIPVSELK